MWIFIEANPFWENIEEYEDKNENKWTRIRINFKVKINIQPTVKCAYRVK
jgi:hypothetical protein